MSLPGKRRQMNGGASYELFAGSLHGMGTRRQGGAVAELLPAIGREKGAENGYVYGTAVFP